MAELTKGDRVRVRRLGSNDKWCECRVELISPNRLSLGLMVEDGAVFTERGGMVTGFIPVLVVNEQPYEVMTQTGLEMEVAQ